MRVSTESSRFFAEAFSSILGAVILISIVLPWFLIVVFFVFIAYFYTALFYRASSRDIKVCFSSSSAYTSKKQVYVMCIYTSVLVNDFSWLNTSRILQWVAKVYLFLDAVLRSLLYSHFSESLTGLATIRAYGEVERFCADNENRVDIENRAYWLSVANQV